MNEVKSNSLNHRTGVINLNSLISILLAIMIFLSFSPFFVWSSFANGIGVTINKIIQIITIILLMCKLPLNFMQRKKLFFGLAMISIFFFYSFFTGTTGGTTHPLLIGNFLVYFFYALNIMSDRKILVKSYKILRKIFAVVLAYTLVIYILILIGMPIPSIEMKSGEAGRAALGWQVYQNYFGCILIEQNGSLLYRFTSVFTEPGVVGTFCAFFLAADGLDLKKNKENWIYLISGLLSLSVAFYIMLILIYALKALRTGGYKLFMSLISIVVIYTVFMSVNFTNPMLLWFQERLMITENGLSGDNRIKEEAEIEYKIFLNSDLKTILLGYGNPEIDENGLSSWQSTSSYKESIYYLGILGYGLMIAWLIFTPLYCYRTQNKIGNNLMYSYIVIFLISQYQRPGMKSWFLVYILLSGCLYAQECADSYEKSYI